jgi:hypothetical protein
MLAAHKQQKHQRSSTGMPDYCTQADMLHFVAEPQMLLSLHMLRFIHVARSCAAAACDVACLHHR